MKRIFQLYILFFSIYFYSQPIITFSDNTFKLKLLSATSTNGVARNAAGTSIKIDVNNDNQIQITEAQNVAHLWLLASNINSIQGIGGFSNLKFLNVSSNNLNSIDVSQNLLLEDLRLENNNVSILNTAQNIQLKNILIGYNNISNLDLTQNVNLETLYCGNNALNNLNVNNNTLLKSLMCMDNNISSINLNNNLLLESLTVDSNPITTLNLINNTNLKHVSCRWINISYLNLSENVILESFNCSNNSLLNIIDVRNGNNHNMFSGTGVTKMNNCPQLTCIYVDSIGITNVLNSWLKDWTATYVNNEAQCNTLSVTDFSYKAAVKIYPNPTNSFIYVKIDNNLINSKYTLLDINGKIIKNGILNNEITLIDISNLDSNVYLLNLNKQNFKILKN